MNFTYDNTMFQQVFEHEFTYLRGFLRNVSRYGNCPALCCPPTGRRWTYLTLNADANRLAHALRTDGVQKNDAVMYALPNSAEFVLLYLAARKVGAINCPVNYKLSPGELALLIEDSEPRVFVYDAEYGETARAALTLSKHKPARIVLTDLFDRAEPISRHVVFRNYVAEQPTYDPPLPEEHIYDEVTRLYTSGTTSRAKGVPINNINEILTAHDILLHFPLGPTDRTMNMTPWFHRGGLHGAGPTPTLYAGGELVILREFHPRRCLQYAERYRATFLVGVPTALAMLARAQQQQHADLSALHGIVTMGAPFDRAACEAYREQLCPNIFNGYGTTETFWNTFLRPYDLPQMAGSAGRSCTDDEVRVVRLHDDGRTEPDELAAHDGEEIGEIIIKASVKSSMCYFHNPDLTAYKFYKGYLYTGDLGTWDENEFITVVGRKDDMIVSSGENIYPAQIESVLSEHPLVLESAVVGEPDPLRGERVAAYVVPASDELTAEALFSYCAAHPMLAPYKRPRVFYLVSELPHTATGKLMHYKLRNA